MWYIYIDWFKQEYVTAKIWIISEDLKWKKQFYTIETADTIFDRVCLPVCPYRVMFCASVWVSRLLDIRSFPDCSAKILPGRTMPAND